MKINITGLRKLSTDNILEANKDYGLFIIASLIGKYIPESMEKEPEEETYYLKCERIDGLVDLKEQKQIEVRKGKLSESQKIRYILEQELGKQGYDTFQEWFISKKLNSLIEEYKEL
jgi:hypothetical protein